MPGFRVLTGVRKEASKMGSRRPLRSVGTQITELTATQSAQLKRSQVHASAITRALSTAPAAGPKNLAASRCARCFCVAAERCVVTCGISTTPGLSVGLSPASGVVRCILVTVENKWGEAAQIDCIAAQEMYRSNRGCQLSAWVQGGGMKSLSAISVVAAAITAPISSVPLRKPRRP